MTPRHLALSAWRSFSFPTPGSEIPCPQPMEGRMPEHVDTETAQKVGCLIAAAILESQSPKRSPEIVVRLAKQLSDSASELLWENEE
jgi:hypothetical protein